MMNTSGIHDVTGEEVPLYIEVLTRKFYPRSILVGPIFESLVPEYGYVNGNSGVFVSSFNDLCF